MYQSIITFACQALDTEERLRPVFDAITAWPGFTPADYDLNQMGSWRGWDDRRAFVDALTQRTQLLRVRGRQPDALVMVAMGKHGEPPTLVIRHPADSPAAALQGWAHFVDTPLAGMNLVDDDETLHATWPPEPDDETVSLAGRSVAWRSDAAPGTKTS